MFVVHPCTCTHTGGKIDAIYSIHVHNIYNIDIIYNYICRLDLASTDLYTVFAHRVVPGSSIKCTVCSININAIYCIHVHNIQYCAKKG